MERVLIVPIWWRRFGSVSEVAIDLTRYDETFNTEVDPWAKNPPSHVWSFEVEGGGKTWHKARYRYLIQAARDVAAQAAIASIDRLVLLPSVRSRMMHPWEETMAYDERIFKQLEFVRATSGADMFDKRTVRLVAGQLELPELIAVLDDPNVLYGATLLTEFGNWRLQVKLCAVCGRFHAPADYCGPFKEATSEDG